MLNLAAPALVQLVTYLTNRCLPEGAFPTFSKSRESKSSQVTGQVMLMQSKPIVPVSILLALGRATEKNIFTRYHQFLNTNHMLWKKQKGCRTIMSTLNALVSVTLENRKKTS